MKTCSTCKASKPLTEFYRSGGFLSSCKECKRAYARANRAKRVDYYRQFDRDRHANNQSRRDYDHAQSRQWRKDNPKRHAQLTAEWRLRNPEKYQAHIILNNAKNSGKISPMSCAHCDNPKTDAHHHDYSRPLDVTWLCHRCHAQRHVDERAMRQ